MAGATKRDWFVWRVDAVLLFAFVMISAAAVVPSIQLPPPVLVALVALAGVAVKSLASFSTATVSTAKKRSRS